MITEEKEDSVLLTEEEAANLLAKDVTVQQLRKWRYRGEGPRFIVLPNRRVYYREEDIHKFLGGKHGRN
jgi:predicted site-specific integrase-resolvase